MANGRVTELLKFSAMAARYFELSALRPARLDICGAMCLLLRAPKGEAYQWRVKKTVLGTRNLAKALPLLLRIQKKSKKSLLFFPFRGAFYLSLTVLVRTCMNSHVPAIQKYVRILDGYGAPGRSYLASTQTVYPQGALYVAHGGCLHNALQLVPQKLLFCFLRPV